MTFNELKKEMKAFNEKHNICRKVDCKYFEDEKGKVLIEMIARVVIAKKVFKPEFSDIKYRTYEFNNYNKALTSDDLGYSIFAYNIYDRDMIRIENYANADFESCEIIGVWE